MNEEKDFFKTCFNTVAGLEVKNESQAIAKEVILSEIDKLQGGINKAIKYLEEPNRDSFDYSKATLLDILKEVSK